MFTERDVKQLKERGIEIQEAERQLNWLRQGFPFMKLAKSATINNGIRKLSDKQIKDYLQLYESSGKLKKLKFIPASGAATRMFKALFEFDELFRQSEFDAKILNREAYKHVKECFDRIRDFAFYQVLESAVEKSGTSIEKSIKNKDYHIVLSSLLGEDGLNFGNMPKGILPFHRYNRHTRTAVEEHLVEGSGYAVNNGAVVDIHLTVSPEHRHAFEELLNRVSRDYENQYNIKFNITYSVQKPSTDTVAIDEKNAPFRESNGSLHFRPGGHGALLENLNEMDADIVFIKNIDNVTHDRNKAETVTFKKALAGMLVYYRERIFNYLAELDKKTAITHDRLKEIASFLGNELGNTVSSKILQHHDEALKYLHSKLNRPLRICGMVKNEGEPGGGPFWTMESDGTKTLQIVESSQVNTHDPEQAAILNSSTHFNPVDLVCGIKDYKGRKFDLLSFRDPDTGFISKKFRNGKPLKALELPGLWNGSMAHWNTIFVEVPGNTFTPVKTVYDLLRPEHQDTV